MSSLSPAALFAAGAVAVVVTRVQLLPEVIDFTFIPTCSGAVGLAAMGTGATLRFSPERLGRITMFGQLTGAALGVLVLAVGLVAG
jgi:hypothetical protein